MAFSPCLVRAEGDGRGLIRIGHPLLDAYLELVAARARPNTVLAHAYDLKVFFTVMEFPPDRGGPMVRPGGVARAATRNHRRSGRGRSSGLVLSGLLRCSAR